MCTECGKRISLKTRLHTHQNLHAEGNCFTCSTCGRSFCKKWDFYDHCNVHTTHKVFPFVECSKNFSTKGVLQKHHNMGRNHSPATNVARTSPSRVDSNITREGIPERNP
ncbi:hypothetical protein XELAEV_18002366mg [Xenopus laevis]|nr:hypothetical protein XELAEV_18002366mg [Xenopus laevis]